MLFNFDFPPQLSMKPIGLSTFKVWSEKKKKNNKSQQTTRDHVLKTCYTIDRFLKFPSQI